MTLRVEDAPQADLPGEATNGFKLIDGDETMMFFHWHNEPEENVHTSYADVLTVLPDRLAAMGYESDAAAIMGEIIGRYGAG